MPTSDTNRKTIMSDFPAGLRMLVVEGNQSCNFVLETMLKKLQYQVTTCRGAREALELLREDKSRIDLVLSDLHMPDMDDFELLRILCSEMDLPVVIMSGDDDRIDVIMKVIIDGACDYLMKPISEEVAKVMWQHVVRKKKDIYLGEWSRKNVQDNGDQALILKQPDHHAEESNHMSLQLVENEGNIKINIKRNRDYDQDGSEVSDNRITNQKKRRIIWTNELHEKFVIAVNQLGGDKAVPKKILERMKEMDVGDLSRENVASHLQKYRIYLQRQTDGPHEIELSLLYMDDKRSIFEQYSSSESDHHGMPAPIIPNASIDTTPSVVNQRNPNCHSHYCPTPSFSNNPHGCITRMGSCSGSGSRSMLPDFYNNLPLPSDHGYQFKPIENIPRQFSRNLSGINNETSFDHVNMFDSRFTGTHFIPLTDFCNSSSSTPHNYCSLGAADHANLVPYITNMGNNIENQYPEDVLPMAECENMSDLLMSEPQPLYYVKPFDHQNESLDGGSPFM